MGGRKYDYGYSPNKEIYEFQFGARIIVLAVVGVGAVIGALAGLGLSFTALSPLVIGGVVGAVFPALLALVAIGVRYYLRNDINEWKKKEGIVEKRVIAALTPPFLFATIASVATGVGLAAITNAVLPGIFATWWATAAGAGE
ncbi:putative membrane protein [Trichonephila clavata]|uniref:Putative membrane protein n=1 Tax=Trichonephila clavata TaxID=2740835 RepID=A0A8X6EXK7_TRICU|nr:putative membrane protein [Trichonephila clavata]GFQ94372.1 putative membrane protein [Trichonephila clavata]